MDIEKKKNTQKEYRKDEEMNKSDIEKKKKDK